MVAQMSTSIGAEAANNPLPQRAANVRWGLPDKPSLAQFRPLSALVKADKLLRCTKPVEEAQLDAQDETIVLGVMR